MKIGLIVAVGRNGVIGREGEMPWHLPADLKRFKALTMGKPIIMGRKTHESIGRALPGRLNIVLTRQADYQAPGCEVVGTAAEALSVAAAAGAEEAMVIGGEAVYRLFWPLADRLYLTLVDGEFEGDAYFAPCGTNGWREVHREEIPADARNPFATSFVILERPSREEGGRPPARGSADP